jgi:hypothetical protein
VTGNKREIAVSLNAAIAESHLSEPGQFAEADPSFGNDADWLCHICGDTNGVRAIPIGGDDLLVCRSCKQNYFGFARPLAAC